MSTKVVTSMKRPRTPSGVSQLLRSAQVKMGGLQGWSLLEHKKAVRGAL